MHVYLITGAYGSGKTYLAGKLKTFAGAIHEVLTIDEDQHPEVSDVEALLMSPRHAGARYVSIMVTDTDAARLEAKLEAIENRFPGKVSRVYRISVERTAN